MAPMHLPTGEGVQGPQPGGDRKMHWPRPGHPGAGVPATGLHCLGDCSMWPLLRRRHSCRRPQCRGPALPTAPPQPRWEVCAARTWAPARWGCRSSAPTRTSGWPASRQGAGLVSSGPLSSRLRFSAPCFPEPRNYIVFSTAVVEGELAVLSFRV